MISRHSIQILCWMLIVNSTVKNVHAISFDDIFDYFLDALGDGDESDELDNSNINVPCKNCNLSVVCHNCTTIDKVTQSTQPIQTSTQNIQTSSSPLPMPTIPAPDRVDSLNTEPSAGTATTTQSTSTTGSVPPTNTATTKSSPPDAATRADSPNIDNGEQVSDDQTSVTTGSESNTDSDGVTVENTTTSE